MILFSQLILLLWALKKIVKPLETKVRVAFEMRGQGENWGVSLGVETGTKKVLLGD